MWTISLHDCQLVNKKQNSAIDALNAVFVLQRAFLSSLAVILKASSNGPPPDAVSKMVSCPHPDLGDFIAQTATKPPIQIGVTNFRSWQVGWQRSPPQLLQGAEAFGGHMLGLSYTCTGTKRASCNWARTMLHTAGNHQLHSNRFSLWTSLVLGTVFRAMKEVHYCVGAC